MLSISSPTDPYALTCTIALSLYSLVRVARKSRGQMNGNTVSKLEAPLSTRPKETSISPSWSPLTAHSSRSKRRTKWSLRTENLLRFQHDYPITFDLFTFVTEIPVHVTVRLQLRPHNEVYRKWAICLPRRRERPFQIPNWPVLHLIHIFPHICI